MFFGQLQLQGYLQDPALSFCGFGDIASDRAPLQVSDFGQGLQIDQMISKLFLEGGGGANLHESYELVAYFYLENCEFSQGIRPFFFITGDEMFYNELLGVDVQEFIGNQELRDLDSKSLWAKLKEKYEVFHLHKPYPGPQDKEIKEQWQQALGKARVLEVSSAKACIDVVLGAIALSSGTRSLQGYLEDMRDRGQTEDRVQEVRDSLRDFAQLQGFLLEENNANFAEEEEEEEKAMPADIHAVRRHVSHILEKGQLFDGEVHVNIKELKSFEEKFKEKIPQDFYCPITQMLFVDPVVASDGNTYEREAIEFWLKDHEKSPLTNIKLRSKELTKNTVLKKLMNDFLERHKN